MDSNHALRSLTLGDLHLRPLHCRTLDRVRSPRLLAAHAASRRPPQALRRCTALRRFHLRACPLGDAGLQALSSVLSASKVQELRLDGCALDDRSVSIVLSIAKAHRDRRDAAAWTGTLRAHGAPTVQQRQISADGLLLLSLCDNAITDRGATQLASHLTFGWIRGATCPDPAAAVGTSSYCASSHLPAPMSPPLSHPGFWQPVHRSGQGCDRAGRAREPVHRCRPH